MPNVGELFLNLHNWKNGVAKIKANLVPEAGPLLRMGILGAAAINYVAILDPIQTHPGIVLTGLAARSVAKAEAQIAKYNLKDTKAYGSYTELLAAPDIDAVYIPLPNGLHAEWAVKSMEAGKHVLIEKPMTSNAVEAREVRAVAERTGLVALEAFHWRFHPAAHTLKEIIERGDYGHVKEVSASMYLPAGILEADDIRLNYELAGGACMDFTYVFSSTSYFGSPDATQSTYKVLSANSRKNKSDPRVDESMVASFTIDYPGKPQVLAHVSADLVQPKLWGIVPKYWDLPPVLTIELERARIIFNNFVAPTFSHSIVIQPKSAAGNLTGEKTTKRIFTDGPSWETRGKSWWTTYRYQLEAFVEKVKSVKQGSGSMETNVPWVSLQESVQLMELIDAVYVRANMSLRGVQKPTETAA